MADYKFIFENYREIHPDNYKELGPVFQKEMELIARFDSGWEDKSIEGFMKICRQEFPDDPNWGLYDVVSVENPGKVLYHFWRYFDEYGSLFHAETGEDTGIAMMNFDFSLHDGSPQQETLCNELQTAFYEEE